MAKESEPKAWKVGDLVKLRSSGPRMTVAGSSKRGDVDVVDCQWFDQDKHLQTGSFPGACLEAD